MPTDPSAGISADLIFCLDKPCKGTEVEDLVRMLYSCDDHSVEHLLI